MAIGRIISSDDGLMQVNWQHFLVEALDPSVVIGSIFQQQLWVNAIISAAFLGRSTGPICGHWQRFSVSNSGPMQVYLQHFLVETLSTIMDIGSVTDTTSYSFILLHVTVSKCT